MANRNRITIRQSQRLSLNTRLVASIQVMAMDALGLSRYLEEMAAGNPQLVVEPAPVVAGDWLPRWGDAFARMGGGGGGGRDLAETVASAGPSLMAHVEAQVEGLRLPREDMAIAQALIEALEPSGWLGVALADIAREMRVGVARVEEVLQRLQRVEPRGLFARNLAECLALQAAEEGWLDAVALGVLDRLPMVAAGETKRLATALGCGEAEVLAVIRRIRGLDPKPGARFAAFAAPVREPDLIARRGAAGWEVALNRSSLPSLRLAEATGEGRAEARALIRLVEGRNATLLRVAGEILARQSAALDEGPGALHPLTMAEVAEALGLNQSTVSRVVAGAAVDTPQGTWWLRAMFSQAIRDRGPSAASLREALSRMIAAEDPAAPMSDTDLSEALGGAGAPVARRTVAKYREMLGIPPAHVRRARQRLGRGKGSGAR